MPDATTTIDEASVREDKLIDVCSVCAREARGELISTAALPDDLKTIIAANTVSPNLDEVCAGCLEIFDRAKRQLDSHATVFEQNDFLLPTPLRVDADERFTGRGVTIAFLDSGFYGHPDLTQPRNRIRAYQSIFASAGDTTSLETTDVASWHGMMTSVVAAGSGALSSGVY